MHWVTTAMRQPVIAHWIRAAERFNGRLGRQFAAAITYFSVLSMVPILMVAFAGVGLTVTVINPALLEGLKDSIASVLPTDSDLGRQINALVDDAFRSWQTVGAVGLPSALWTGSVWVKNVRAAVRAQIRDDFDDQEKDTIVVATVKNVATLIGFVSLLGATTAMSSVAVALRHQLAVWFPDAAAWVGSAGYTAITLVGTFAGGFGLFCFIFWLLPAPRITGIPLVKAGIMGAVGMAALQYLAGLLVGVFRNNAAAAVFGNSIVLILFFNVLATLILIVAAWLGTIEIPQPTAIEEAAAMPHHPTTYASKLIAARLAADNTRADTVPTPVAVNATRVGVGLGAAGMALLAGVAAVIGGRRGK
ncbi:MAG: YhjD/YihY/BrkB family envelope integrity protein [Propioniciclava sp.]